MMMGQIDLAIFSVLLLSFFSGTKADCLYEKGFSRSDLYSQFMKTWSHLYCGISHEGREHNQTRRHDLLHDSREEECLEDFESYHPIVKAFFNPVMECIGDRTDSRRKDSSCYQYLSQQSLTPRLKDLGKDLVRSFVSCCSHNDQASTYKENRMLKSRNKPIETAVRSHRCIRRKFTKLLESFNANNDPLEHLDMLVNSN